MKNKGFTLIELIAVIVIIGMLLVIVIPATGRLISSNDKKTYDQYYDLVKEAAIRYARGESYDLGGVSHSGCKDVTTLDEFMELGILKSFSINDEEIECYLPSELRTYTKVKESEINNLEDGKGPSDFYDIRINNDKGKLTIKHSLVCVRDNKTIVYKRLSPKDVPECKKYEPDKVNVLYNYITDASTSRVGAQEGDYRYVNNDKNYVKYSGKLWQIVSVNTIQKTVKLVSAETVGYYTFDESTSAKYRDSNIENWINQEFKLSLRNPSIFLKDAGWDFPVESSSTPSALPAAVSTTEVQNTVGLLNLYEFNKVKSKIAKTQSPWFLITPKSDTEIWMVKSNSTAVEAVSANTTAGIRPAIELRANVTFVEGGEGTADKPLLVIGEQSGLAGEKLKSRYAGEYVKVQNYLYRITSIDSDGTKLVSSEYSMQGIFDNSNIYVFGDMSDVTENIKRGMNEGFYNNLSTQDKALLTDIEYCTSFYNNAKQYTYNCENQYKRTGHYAIPKIGDMYAVPRSGENYWTLSPSKAEVDPISGEIKDPEVYVMSSTGLVSTVISSNTVDGAGIKYYPVILIKPEAKITGGSGTSSSPYTVSVD